jgi:hypothetical protein
VEVARERTKKIPYLFVNSGYDAHLLEDTQELKMKLQNLWGEDSDITEVQFPEFHHLNLVPNFFGGSDLANFIIQWLDDRCGILQPTFKE